MATYIQGNDCTNGCGADPCCNLDEGGTQSTDGPATITEDIDVTGCTPSDLSVIFEWAVVFSDGYARFRLLADAVEIYDTGCVNNTATDSDTVVVPSGTSTLTVEVTQECSGTWVENAWEWLLYPA